MKVLQVTLLGRFEATWNREPVPGFEHAKARELFCYLLLNRDKPNLREHIASQLWGGHYTTDVSKKYLRKALWQLNECLAHCSHDIQSNLIAADNTWLELKSTDSLWLDVAFLEDAYQVAKGVEGTRLDGKTVHLLSGAVELYRGELLEGEYQEWTFYELIRYRQIALILLDKLMDYSIAKGEYELALEYGHNVLRHDSAREAAHLKVMAAYYALGDRTSAIRQFIRCRQILAEELDVKPSKEATRLFEKIRADDLDGMDLIPGLTDGEAARNGQSPSKPGLGLIITNKPKLTPESPLSQKNVG